MVVERGVYRWQLTAFGLLNVQLDKSCTSLYHIFTYFVFKHIGIAMMYGHLGEKTKAEMDGLRQPRHESYRDYRR